MDIINLIIFENIHITINRKMYNILYSFFYAQISNDEIYLV